MRRSSCALDSQVLSNTVYLKASTYRFLRVDCLAWQLRAGSTALGRNSHIVAPSTPWMSAYGFTLVYLVAAGLLLSSLSRTNVLFRVMNFRPLRSLGKYSYGCLRLPRPAATHSH